LIGRFDPFFENPHLEDTLMLRAQLTLIALTTVSLIADTTLAGPFAPAAGQVGTTALAKTDPSIAAWATSVEQLTRGKQDISNAASALANVGAVADVLGNNAGVLSLGDAGSITLGFAQPIANAAGYDFAVFENGFASGSLAYLELAFVEVSSNGTDFFRFNATSLTPTATQIGSFGLIDATNLNNLAGKYVGNFGTPFDLAELAGTSPLLDVNNVQFVRLIDVVGTTNPLYATLDSQGNIVNDPWSTAFGSGGFDLDAVGVINQVPEPASWWLAAIALRGIKRARIRSRRRLGLGGVTHEN
jgi:hypothetical protein